MPDAFESGVNDIPLAVGVLTCLIKGQRPSFLPPYTTQDQVIAHAGGGITFATLLQANFNNITVCATNGDSCRLQPAIAGLFMVILNNSTHDAMMFASGTDVFGNNAVGVGFTVSVTTGDLFICLTTGTWHIVALGATFG